MTQDELKLVLDALKWCHGGEPCGTAEAIAVVEKALAQPEQFCDANCVWTDHHPDCKLAQPQQEPVAWMHVQGNYKEPSFRELADDEVERGWEQYPLYNTPPQRTWVGLTDEDIQQSYETTGHYQTLRPQDRFAVFALARAIEAKLKQKNHVAQETNS